MDVTEYLGNWVPVVREHLINYITTDGEIGYLRDHSHLGGSKVTPHLLLKTIGRKSGRPNILPLIYAPWADEYVVIASKGGDANHPAWYLNMQANSAVEFQLRNKIFRGTAREAQGAEREKLWNYVTAYFPPFAEYQAKTARRVPVMVLTAAEKLNERWTISPAAIEEARQR